MTILPAAAAMVVAGWSFTKMVWIGKLSESLLDLSRYLSL